eukprot:s1846_g10.t1
MSQCSISNRKSLVHRFNLWRANTRVHLKNARDMAAAIRNCLIQWLDASTAVHELDTFIRQNAATFDDSEEQRHLCFEIFQRYEGLVDRLLNEFLEEHRRDVHLAGIDGGAASVRRLLAVCQEEGACAAGSPEQRILDSLLRITTYEDYVRISLDFKRAAEEQAAQMLQRLAVQVAGGVAKTLPDARLESQGPSERSDFLPPKRQVVAFGSREQA